MLRISSALLAASLLVAAAGCDQPRAHGDANAIIVGASPELWADVEDVILEALEPTILTARHERPFRVTHQDPTEGEFWGNLRRFRQVVVIGDRGDFWVSEALDAHREGEAADPPEILQVRNLWARGQSVTVLLLPETGQREAATALVQPLAGLLDDQFRDWVRGRMFVSGRDTGLADSLSANVGFSVVLPNVYRYAVRDSVFRFRNDNPSPTELIREVAVTWKSPLPDENPTQAELEEWRDEFTAEYYVDPQLVDTSVVSAFQEIEVNGTSGLEFQAAWVNPPDYWIAGGPFITRALRCPDQDRLYLVDAWLYAPGRDKYEYMIQLETILDSFRCG